MDRRGPPAVHEGRPKSVGEGIVCGLSGEFRFDGGPPDVEGLARISAVMAPRGPDGHGLWHDGPVALAHRRLKIIDLTEAGVAADGRRRAAPGQRLQRLHLQLPAAARRAARRGLPVLLHLRHRGDRQGLPPLGRRLCRPLHGHVRVRHPGAHHGPADPGPGPAGHQAAVPGPDPRTAAVRLVIAGPAGRRRHRHLDRPGRAEPLPDVPRGGAAAANHPAGRAEAAAGHRAGRRAGRHEHRSPLLVADPRHAWRSMPD